MLQYPQTEAHGLLGPKSLLSWRVSLSVAHGAAILSSIFRLHRRKETGHFGIDDHFAMGALLLDCAFFPTLWMTATNSKDVLIAAAWLSQLLFIPLLWGARISLALSISRFIPAHQKTRKAAIFLAYIFGTLCVAFLIQISVTCAKTYHHWSQTVPYQCPISSPSAIVRIIVECACDVALVFIPFYAFWGRLRLTVMTRRFIQGCFCASLITAVSTLLISGILFSHHNSKSAVQRGETGFIAGVMSHLMATISLLVCNLLVVATSFYRFFRAKEVVRPVGEAPPLPPIPPVDPAPIAQPQSVDSPQNEIKNRTEGEVSSTNSVTRDTTDNAPTPLELTEIFLTEVTPSDSTIDSYVTYHDACSKKNEQ